MAYLKARIRCRLSVIQAQDPLLSPVRGKKPGYPIAYLWHAPINSFPRFSQ